MIDYLLQAQHWSLVIQDPNESYNYNDSKKIIFNYNQLHVLLSKVSYFGSLPQGLPDFYVNVTERFHLYDRFRGRVVIR